MPGKPVPWYYWVAGMGERRKLGDVALDLLLFAGMVWRLRNPINFGQTRETNSINPQTR